MSNANKERNAVGTGHQAVIPDIMKPKPSTEGFKLGSAAAATGAASIAFGGLVGASRSLGLGCRVRA